MPYHNFKDVQDVAKFLADIDFTIVGKSKGTFSPDHMAYHCNLSKGDAAFGTTYQNNPAFSGEPTVIDVLSAMSMDALDVADRNIDDFADELGFTKPSEAIRANERLQANRDRDYTVRDAQEESVSLKGEAAASREAADVLASKTGHGEHLLDTR